MSDCFDHAADAYDDLCFGRTADEGYSYRIRTRQAESIGTTCRFCGTPYLRWRQVSGRWALYDGSKAHSCEALPARLAMKVQNDLDDFDAL